MNATIDGDPRNIGIEVSAHYGSYLNPNVLVYDLKSVSGENSKADVFRVFLQYSETMRERDFQNVEISFRGTTKFIIQGEYFKQLGEEYGTQNPVYTIRTFPENLYLPESGETAYSRWTGGMIGVLSEQMKDCDSFHARWYFDDYQRQ